MRVRWYSRREADDDPRCFACKEQLDERSIYGFCPKCWRSFSPKKQEIEAEAAANARFYGGDDEDI
jgi:hypothetical protein